MNAKLEAKLNEMGAREWRGGEHHRFYFNELAKFYGLEISRYNSGNIRSATLEGAEISNGSARQILDQLHDLNIYYDVNTGEIVARKDNAMSREVIEAIEAELAEAMKEEETAEGAENQETEEENMFEKAKARVENTPELVKYKDVILADWNEGDEHWGWVATAPVDEIVDWVQSMR